MRRMPPTSSMKSIDVLLGRVPQLDLEAVQRKLVQQKRGGYCFEQNILLRAGLRALGFDVTSLAGRAVRGWAADAPRRALHMALRVDLTEGPFLIDVGFGNITPTAPLAMVPDLVQETPHGLMRLITVNDELTLQAMFGNEWQNIFRCRLALRWMPTTRWQTGLPPPIPPVRSSPTSSLPVLPRTERGILCSTAD